MINVILTQNTKGSIKRFVESYYDGLIEVNKVATRYVLTYNNPIAAHDIISLLLDNELDIDLTVVADNKKMAVNRQNRDKILTYILKKAL